MSGVGSVEKQALLEVGQQEEHKLEQEESWQYLNYGFFKQAVWSLGQDIYFNTMQRDWKTQEGGRAYDAALSCLSPMEDPAQWLPAEDRKLFEGCKEDDVVILNFGSLTSPDWRAYADRMVELQEKFEQYQFRHIYISEAHPRGWWETVPRPASEQKRTCYRDPKEIGQRILLVRRFRENEGKALAPHSIWVDTMENLARDHYQAWPVRLYAVRMIRENEELVPRIIYKGGAGHGGYDPDDLKEFLEQKAPNPAEWKEDLETWPGMVENVINGGLCYVADKVYDLLSYFGVLSEEEPPVPVEEQ